MGVGGRALSLSVSVPAYSDIFTKLHSYGKILMFFKLSVIQETLLIINMCTWLLLFTYTDFLLQYQTPRERYGLNFHKASTHVTHTHRSRIRILTPIHSIKSKKINKLIKTVMSISEAGQGKEIITL